MPKTYPIHVKFAHFLRNESGAVTVDWVVLAAAITGLGIGTVAAVRSGAMSLGNDVSSSLSGTEVASLSCMGVNDGPSGFDCYDGPTVTGVGLASAWATPGYCWMSLDGGGGCTEGASGSSESFSMSDGSTYYRNTSTQGGETTISWTDGSGNSVDEPPPFDPSTVRHDSGCWETGDGYMVCA